MEKEKLSVTINKDLIEKIDSIIDDKKIKDRSEATEFLITEGLGLNKIKKAFIQAGGLGMRLRPFTLEVPKPLMPLQGKPLILHSLELLKSHGIKEIYIAIGYKGDQIKNYFGDGRNFGVKIKYIEEKEPLGTAGALKLAKKYLDETFLLVWCDILADIDLDDFAVFHKKNGGVATMALSPVEDVTQFGIADLKDSKIIKFVEKPRREETPSNLNNAGYTILEPEVFKYFPDKKVISIEREVYPKIVAAGEMFGFPFSGQWYDTGTHEAYEKAIMGWKGHRAGKK
jgi:NDP-sugar pyrophosphorylase family protein